MHAFIVLCLLTGVRSEAARPGLRRSGGLRIRRAGPRSGPQFQEQAYAGAVAAVDGYRIPRLRGHVGVPAQAAAAGLPAAVPVTPWPRR
jgi:hypothetical protein